MKGILKKGQGFGEKAILSNDKRTATCICLENSGFIVFGKSTFELILDGLKKEKEMKTDFIK